MLRYAITDRRLNPVSGHDPFSGLVEQARRLARDRVDFLQVREKDLEAKELIGLLRRIITAARKDADAGGPDLNFPELQSLSGPSQAVRVLVNGRPDVALAAGADGVHLPSGEEQLTVGQVRRVFGERKSLIVSVACHTLAEVESASRDEADLILFSPVFGKAAADGSLLEATGLVRLAEACRAAGATPVFALGGVNAANAQSCIEAGAKGIAGIRLFQGTPPPEPGAYPELSGDR